MKFARNGILNLVVSLGCDARLRVISFTLLGRYVGTPLMAPAIAKPGLLGA